MTEKEKKDLILNKCPNYDKISNYIYLENDNISIILIEKYQDYVFSVDIDDNEEIIMLELVNKAFTKYISDYNFSKMLTKYLEKFLSKNKNKNIKVEDLMQEVVNFANQYEEEKLKHIVNSRWI